MLFLLPLTDKYFTSQIDGDRTGYGYDADNRVLISRFARISKFFKLSHDIQLPKEVDWQKRGVLSPVKNQVRE